MPLYTEHLSLAKPTRDERYNTAVPNGNMDILDEHVQLLTEKNRLLEEVVAGLQEELANKVIMGAPHVFDLELCNGIVGGSQNIYWKNANEQVFVQIALGGSSISNGMTIAVLPEGFRPNENATAPAMSATSTRMSSAVSVRPDGSIVAAIDANNTVNQFVANCTFIASQ